MVGDLLEMALFILTVFVCGTLLSIVIYAIIAALSPTSGLFWLVILLAIVGTMFLGGVIAQTFYQFQSFR